MGVSERRQRERQARRSSVIDAARGLLLEKGFNGATTKQIAERCELSEATLFFYFKNKDEILSSILFESIDFWAEGFNKVAGAKLQPDNKLARLWKFFKKVREEHPEYFFVSAYLARPYAMADVSDEIKNKIVDKSGENFQRLAAILEDITGRSDGRIMADFVWSTFLGLMVLRDSRDNLNSTPHPSDRDLVAIFDMLKTSILAR